MSNACFTRTHTKIQQKFIFHFFKYVKFKCLGKGRTNQKDLQKQGHILNKAHKLDIRSYSCTALSERAQEPGDTPSPHRGWRRLRPVMVPRSQTTGRHTCWALHQQMGLTRADDGEENLSDCARDGGEGQILKMSSRQLKSNNHYNYSQIHKMCGCI